MSFRNRQMCSVLYEEDETHLKAIKKIEREFDSALIRHDMDVYEEDIFEDGKIIHHEGEFKKPHYHVVLKFANARSSKSVAKDLGITENYLEPCKKYRQSMEYLIHLNNPEKYLYNVDEVKGTLKRDLVKFLNNHEKDENVRVQKVYDWIRKQPRPLTINKLSQYCFNNGYWDVFRRSSVIFFKIVEEHNFCKNNFYLDNYEDVTDEVIEQLGGFEV